MSVRVGINGFGRMGRLALRAAVDRKDLREAIEIVHVNEIKGGVACAAHLLEYDTVHGRWDRGISADHGHLTVNDSDIRFTEFAAPGEIPWEDSGVDLVIEATGKFKTSESIRPHFARGAKKAVAACPVKDDGALNIVMGVNDGLYDPDKHDILTAASCTTNCLAPVVKVIHENLRIVHGSITTIHDVTNTQVMVDAPHKDLRRARSGLNALIPTSTGSATAITLIYPELKGKLNGLAVRVPLLNASLTDCVFEVARDTAAEEVNALLRRAANEAPLAGILRFEDKPLVSTDFVNDPASSIVDGPSTMVIDGRQVKIYAWYDNEWGYVNRMMELAAKVATSL
ncbi:MAG: ArsJ-associated glyceraldehyde-3-phosphate dehydrogenase [Rhodospirillales bacterium]